MIEAVEAAGPGAVAGVLVAGFLAGTASGLLGVGGGVLFVPALALLLGLGPLEAVGTSLLAVVPTAAVGAARQHRYGNLRLGEGLALGGLSLAGVLAGTEMAHRVPERVLSTVFALLMLYTAFRLARRALGRA